MRPGILVLVLLGWLAVASLPASARLSDPEAVELMSGVYERAIRVTAFQSEFHLIRQDPAFLELFFPRSEFHDNLSLDGIVNYDSPTRQYNLYFRMEGVDYQHFTAKGNAVAYLGQERIYNLLKDARPVVVQVSPSPSPSPSPGASPTPSPSPSALVEPAGSFKDLSPQDRRPVVNHPLLYVWPYVLHQPDIRSKYDLLSKKELVFGRLCWLIGLRDSDSPARILLWVDPVTQQVVQIETTDATTGQKVTATYTGFNPPDKQTGYSIYNRVQVDVDGQSVFLAELTAPQINPNRIVTTGGTGEPAGSDGNRRPRNTDVGPAVTFLTGGLIFLVSLLGLVLLVLGYRYWRFAVSRQEFSDELVLIDEEDGRFGELLVRLGYPVERFNAELLTQERLLLGKGATADTTRRPRGVIVAPESFGEVKSYFFLLRAYVEEGGRVLVMYHSMKAAAAMPFSAGFIPLNPGDAATEYVCKPGVFSTLADTEVSRLAGALAARELYTQANDRPLAQEIVVGRNKDTGVKGCALGVLRQGKGEYILCQLRFDPQVTASSGPIRRLLADLILHLQARKPVREEKLTAVS